MKRLLYAACLFLVLLPWIVALVGCVIVARRAYGTDTITPVPAHLAPLVQQWVEDQSGDVKVEDASYHSYHWHLTSAADHITVHLTSPLINMDDPRLRGARQDRWARLVMQNGKLVETPP